MKNKKNIKDILHPKLRLIHGGKRNAIKSGHITIVASPEYRQPFSVEAMASEEDTYLVMGSGPAPPPREHSLRIFTKGYNTKPADPGSIIIKKGKPLRILAIVHDLNLEPTWREEWVFSALNSILKEVKKRNISSLALPLLGTRYGSLELVRFAALLEEALSEASPECLRKLWLIAPLGNCRKIIDMISRT